MKKSFVFFGLLSCVPMLASNSDDSFVQILGFMAVAFIIIVAINIFFLMAQSAFAKSMKLTNREKETSIVWIWTQLIPLWNLVAIPITLLKLNEQYKTYVLENDSSNIKPFNVAIGWAWYISSILAIFIPSLGTGVILGVLIYFWIHISKVRKSIEANLKV